MENEAKKIEIRLLLVIGFCLGCGLGAALGAVIVVSSFDGPIAGIVCGILIGFIAFILASIFGAIAVWQARRKGELVRGSGGDFFGGIAVGAFLAACGTALYLLGAKLGFSFAFETFTRLGIGGGVRNLGSALIGFVAGCGLAWAAWHLLGRLTHYIVQKMDKDKSNEP